jgi:hypothetical protein
MAEKIKNIGNGISKAPSFNKESKMTKYEIIFDEDVQQVRTGFFNKNLYKIEVNYKYGDTYWIVEAGYEYRTDLISYKFYGTAKYDWIIEEINNIKDPIKDVKIGTKLIILSSSRISTII